MDVIGPIDAAEIARRLRHVLGLSFTAVTGLGLLAALALWAGGATRRADRPSSAVVASASFALLAVLVPPDLLAVAVVWLVAFHAAVERLPPAPSRVVVLVLLALLVVICNSLTSFGGGSARTMRWLHLGGPRGAWPTSAALMPHWLKSRPRWRMRSDREIRGRKHNPAIGNRARSSDPALSFPGGRGPHNRDLPRVLAGR